MKTFRILLVAFILSALALVAFGQSTNNVALPPELNAVLSVLPESWKAFIAPWIVRAAILNMVLSIFSPWLNNRIRNGLNKLGEGKDEDVDKFLTRLFAFVPYRILAVVLRLIGVNLPTTSEHDRLVKMLNEEHEKGQTEMLARAAGQIPPNNP